MRHVQSLITLPSLPPRLEGEFLLVFRPGTPAERIAFMLRETVASR